MLEFKECEKCGHDTHHRDGECLHCRPIETFNLCGAAPVPGVLARIAVHLERYGAVKIINSAFSDNPGGCAFLLGEVYAKAALEKQECPTS